MELVSKSCIDLVLWSESLLHWEYYVFHRVSKSAHEEEFGENKKRKEYTHAKGNEDTLALEHKRGKIAKFKGLNFDLQKYLDLFKKSDCCKGNCVRKLGFANTLAVRREYWEAQSLTEQWKTIAITLENCSDWGTGKDGLPVVRTTFPEFRTANNWYHLFVHRFWGLASLFWGLLFAGLDSCWLLGFQTGASTKFGNECSSCTMSRQWGTMAMWTIRGRLFGAPRGWRRRPGCRNFPRIPQRNMLTRGSFTFQGCSRSLIFSTSTSLVRCCRRIRCRTALFWRCGSTTSPTWSVSR